MTRRFRFLAPLAVAALVLAACESGSSPGASGGGGESACDTGSDKISILAVWATGDAEYESFKAMVEPFCEDTGIGIEYEGTRDANSILSTRIQGGNPPDIAGLPGPGAMAQFANEDALVALDDVLDLAAMEEQYGESWIDLASVDGSVYGIFIKASVKGPIWYNPPAFEDAGYTVPESWDDLTALVDQIVDDGGTPWCIGLGSEAATGWPATDWIEDILLRQAGPDVYQQWYTGELPWTDDAVKTAFETYGAWATDPAYVKGGPDGAISTIFQNGGDGIFDGSCFLHHQASFITGLGGFADKEAGTDYDFFMFPEIEHNGVIAAGDLFGMFNDTEQARQLMQYLTTPEAQQIWVERGGALSPNKDVDLEAYPDDISRKSAEALVNAEVVVFDGSDLMPAEMIEGQGGFYETILNYMRDPDQLDSFLEEADATRQSAFGS
jgi:alpha-glucoside transport system substrate-binding protein